MEGKERELRLFGGDIKPWKEQDWTSSDDRVRGGKSQSNLSCNDSTALFHGNLDIETLGGAGFASQRTTGEYHCWDLSSYDGIQVDVNISNCDTKTYTFIIKDQLLDRDPDTGREQATISWEYDFDLAKLSRAYDAAETIRVHIAWKDLQPTYRGKAQRNVKPLNVSGIKRFSIMMRSFFGTQHGPFRLEIATITAFQEPESAASRLSLASESAVSTPESDTILELKNHEPQQQRQPSWSPWSWVFGRCWKI